MPAPGTTPIPARLAMSDVHGHLGAARRRLREHGLVDHGDDWAGGASRLWFLGDYLDRGPHGLAVIDLVRRLQHQAPAAGGEVRPLLGNHELQFLAALHFGERHASGDGETPWLSGWRRYGGVDEELATVGSDQVDWMSSLPLVDLEGPDLLLHSDTGAYLELGRTVAEINIAGREVLRSRDPSAWASLHRVMVQRGDFRSPGGAHDLLETLGAERVVHGHSTLGGAFGLHGDAARRPHVYAEGRALAVDGGVFEDGHLLLAHL